MGVGPTSTYQLLPPLGPEEYRSLKEDIREHGVLVPIVEDEDGTVLDGYHRLRAVHDLRAEGVDIPDPPVDRRTGLSEVAKVLLVAGLNLHRRHLTAYQRVQVGRRIEQYVREAAQERRMGALAAATGRRRAGQVSGTPKPAPAATDTGESRDVVAGIVGLGSGRTYERAKRVVEWVEARAETDPAARDLLARADAGEADIRQLRRFTANAPRPGARAGEEMALPPPTQATPAELKAEDPWVQGRTRYLRVVLTEREYSSLMEWAWSTKDPEWISPLKSALVAVFLSEGDVARYRARLESDGYPGLASCFAAAMEGPDEYADLTSEERAVIRRIRHTDTGVLQVRVVHGTPKVPPLRHWRWGEGKRRRKEGFR